MILRLGLIYSINKTKLGFKLSFKTLKIFLLPFAICNKFRKAFNAGDMFTCNNSATSTLLGKPPNQVNSLRNMFGWQNNAGSVRQEENGSFYSGNPRFVYDGSDYARFKKLQAINRNYNDITFGGDQHNASQHAYRRISS